MCGKRKLSIYISGAHSVGKSTLLEALLKHEEFSKFEFYGQKEIAREWQRVKGYSQEMLQGQEVQFLYSCELVYQQLYKEDAEYSDLHGKFKRFIWDRSVVDQLAYIKVLCKKGAVDDVAKISTVQTALSRMRRNKETHTFVLKPHEKFIESDGIRPDSNMEELMNYHDVFVEMLDQLDIPHTVIENSNLEDRMHIVLDTITRKWPFLVDGNEDSPYASHS